MTTMTRADVAMIAGLFEGANMPSKPRFPDTLFVRLPPGTLDEIERLRGPLPQGEWMRALIVQALESRKRTARRNRRSAKKAEADGEH